MGKQVMQRRYMDNDYEFWGKMLHAVCCITCYYVKHVNKEPCMTSYITREKWINEPLDGHENWFFNMFKMWQITFCRLFADL